MYGDATVMRRRLDQLREQGTDLRALADSLVGRADAVDWQGRAADAFRARVRERAARLRDCAASHDGAADALRDHLREVERLQEAIADAERRGRGDLTGADTEQPPPGHRDWLSVAPPRRSS